MTKTDGLSPDGPTPGESTHDGSLASRDVSLLIVDDDIPFRAAAGAGRWTSAALQSKRLISVSEAKAKVEAAPPAYAVIDMRLEDGNGLTVIEKIRKIRPEARTVVSDRLRQYRDGGDGGEARRHRLSVQTADADEIYAALTQAPDEKAEPPENPMSADRVRWEHIQRVYELCDRNVSETARPPQHAPPHPAAHSRQAGAALRPGGR